MSNEGTNYHAHEMDQGQASGISTSKRSLDGTRDFGLLEEIIKNANTASNSAKRSGPMFEFDDNNALNQQERPSAVVAESKIFPPFAEEFMRDFVAPELSNLFEVTQDIPNPDELFYPVGNMEMGANYGGYFPVADEVPGTGNFYLFGDSSSTLQLPPIQGTSNPQLLQGPKGNIHPIQSEMGESSSPRDVKMKMTLLDTPQQPTKPFVWGYDLISPTTQANIGNPQPPRTVTNALYDPMFEKLGLPIDPHLRMFLSILQEGNAM